MQIYSLIDYSQNNTTHNNACQNSGHEVFQIQQCSVKKRTLWFKMNNCGTVFIAYFCTMYYISINLALLQSHKKSIHNLRLCKIFFLQRYRDINSRIHRTIHRKPLLATERLSSVVPRTGELSGGPMSRLPSEKVCSTRSYPGTGF